MSKSHRDNTRQGSFTCQHCGAQVPAGARACPECGSDERTGWSEEADGWNADLPTGYREDDDFDYEDYLRREFGAGRERILGLPPAVFILVVAGLVLAVLVVLTALH